MSHPDHPSRVPAILGGRPGPMLRHVGVTAALGYVHPSPNLVQRGWQRFGSTATGAWFFSKTLAPMDRVVHRLSKGRTSVPRPARRPARDDGDHDGAQERPAAPHAPDRRTDRRGPGPDRHELRSAEHTGVGAEPRGGSPRPGRVRRCRHRPDGPAATEGERDEIFRTASGIYPGYDKYQERITGRTIRIFVLEVDPG